MVKGISSKIVIGNAILSTNRNEITQKQIYRYWHLFDELLPNGYYTIGNNNSFEEFCEQYSFLVKMHNNLLILNCELYILERYCRLGIPKELIKIFDEAAIIFNENEIKDESKKLLLNNKKIR